LTDFSIIRIKRFIPNRKNMEISTLALILAVQFVKFLLLGFLELTFPNVFGLVILMIAQTAKIAINVFFYAILAQVILSWFPYAYTDVYNILAAITAPIMRPIRRKLKPVGGFDISPIPALILLQFIIILLVDPIFNWGAKIAYN
ncbi:MAG TPA: YggT family protein, partial [Gammaproteobacteria bacterium]|nr:YggT family protein [Gammaproteobacteria bacterium]